MSRNRYRIPWTLSKRSPLDPCTIREYHIASRFDQWNQRDLCMHQLTLLTESEVLFLRVRWDQREQSWLHPRMHQRDIIEIKRDRQICHGMRYQRRILVLQTPGLRIEWRRMHRFQSGVSGCPTPLCKIFTTNFYSLCRNRRILRSGSSFSRSRPFHYTLKTSVIVLWRYQMAKRIINYNRY